MKYKYKKTRSLFYLVVVFLGAALTYAGWKQYASTTLCIRVPIKFSPANIPVLNAIIEGNICPLEIDLGSKFPLTLEKNVLANVGKKPEGVIKWRDLKGDPHESSSYLIPEVNIYGLLWTDILTKEQTATYQVATLLWHDEQQTPKHEEVGTIGRPLLEKANLCLDLSHSTFFICNSLKTLQKKGICPKDLIKVPFHLGRTGMIFQVETDMGNLNLSVDTGCTVTLIRSSLVQDQKCQQDWRGLSFWATSRFLIEGKDFGSLDLYSYSLAPQLEEIDGILGMDFLRKHVIYIDYPNKVLYIGNSQSDSISNAHKSLDLHANSKAIEEHAGNKN